MKTTIFLIAVITLISLTAYGQTDIRASLHLEDLDVQHVDGAFLITSIGEPVYGAHVQNGLFVIPGYYPAFVGSGSTAVPEVLRLTGITAYPNPVSQGIILRDRGGIPNALQISVYSEEGLLLIKSNWNTGAAEFTMDIGHKPAGIYFIVVTEPSSGRHTSMKVIKQH
jgi:hypothetical protein